jgi:hypothetical protein
MSNSLRSARARVRAAYTGEHIVAARQGVGRNGDLGLDRCSIPQQRLRTLLATHLFNAGDTGVLVGTSIVSTLTHYTLTMSPRFDDLVVVAECPTNVPNGVGKDTAELPGLRLSHLDDNETYRLVHLPTGARMTVTGRRRTLFDDTCFASYSRASRDGRRWWTPDVPLTPTERDSLRFNPVPPDGVAQILRALVTRLSARDVSGRWAIGYWFYDPLRRPKATGFNDYRLRRRLIGAGPHWHLQWNGYPYPKDVAAMLLDTTAGLPGIKATGTGRYFDLVLGGETLRIQSESGE